MAEKRKSKVERNSSETRISVNLKIDGEGKCRIDVGIPFLNHMLDLFARHGEFDIEIKGKGDIEIDCHHTVEDAGIVLGQAFRNALGERKGIARYGEAYTPMDESLARVVLDISGRPYLKYDVKMPPKKFAGFDYSLVKEFFRAFSIQSGITLHISLLYGENQHHICEAVFKAFGRALKKACDRTRKGQGIPSTKGRLDS